MKIEGLALIVCGAMIQGYVIAGSGEFEFTEKPKIISASSMHDIDRLRGYREVTIILGDHWSRQLNSGQRKEWIGHLKIMETVYRCKVIRSKL